MRRFMLLADFFKNVYFPRRLRGKSINSVRLYELCLRQFQRTLCRPPTVEDLTEENIYAHLGRRSSVAPATRNKELSQLIAMWRLAAQRGILKTWPDIGYEREPERAPVAWMPEELAKLLSAAGRAPGVVGTVPAKLWWSALLMLMLDTGERISAIRHAKWDWIQGEWMLVPAESRKGKTRDRRYRLSPETQQALELLKSSVGDLPAVFPWPYFDSYFYNKYREIVKLAGLPTGRIYQTHCLRKTVGSAVHASGGSAQDALDHADRRTTQRYLDPRLARKEQPCDILAAYLRSPTKPPAAPGARAKRSG
jgi:integrase